MLYVFWPVLSDMHLHDVCLVDKKGTGQALLAFILQIFATLATLPNVFEVLLKIVRENIQLLAIKQR